MAIKYPIEYELVPTTIDTGRHWVTLNLKNIGNQDLTGLDVNLNSLDAYSMSALGTGSYVSSLKSDEERAIPYQLSANRTVGLYVTADGWRDGKRFHWESPSILVTVGSDVAQLVSLFAMTEPYPILGEKVRCEATVRGLSESERLTLEFWADTPSGAFEELAAVETKALSPNEEATYAAEITPDEEGLYTIYAYLYDGVDRIGRRIEHIQVGRAA